MENLVSLIIPVYNVEEYLRQCFDSVEQQTYQNLEVIIVNDGSTDNSASICIDYAQKNKWIYIEQKNSGLSAARNAGIDVANGDYLCFLDSDDWLEPDMIKTLFIAATTNDAGIVECGLRWVYTDQVVEDCEKNSIILSSHDALQHYLLQTRKIHSQVWCKIYSKEIFQELRFAVGRLHEDGFFAYRAMASVNRYMIVDYCGYNYRQNRAGSIMSVKIKPQNIIDVTDLMEERIDFFKQREQADLAEMAAAYHFRTMLTNYLTSVAVIKDDELAAMLKSRLFENRGAVLKNKYLGVKVLKFIAFYYFPKLFSYIYMKG